MSRLRILATIFGIMALLALGVACTGSPSATANTDQSTGAPQQGTGAVVPPSMPPAGGTDASVGAPSNASAPSAMPYSGTASYAYQQVNGQQSGIWVTGTGKVTVKPDLAIMTVGVEAREKTVADATAKASSAMNAIISALKKHGIADKDIQTQYYNISPEYQYVQTSDGRGKQVLVGYIVNNSVTVKIRDLDSVGSVIDDLAGAGGDLTRINGISFTVENTTALMNQARELAVKDALAKAKQFADLTGMNLGKLAYISETGSYYPVVMRSAMDFAKAEGAAAPTPISSGELDIQLTIQAVFDIQ